MKPKWSGPKDVPFIKDPEERRIQYAIDIEKLIEKHKNI